MIGNDETGLVEKSMSGQDYWGVSPQPAIIRYTVALKGIRVGYYEGD